MSHTGLQEPERLQRRLTGPSGSQAFGGGPRPPRQGRRPCGYRPGGRFVTYAQLGQAQPCHEPPRPRRRLGGL